MSLCQSVGPAHDSYFNLSLTLWIDGGFAVQVLQTICCTSNALFLFSNESLSFPERSSESVLFAQLSTMSVSGKVFWTSSILLLLQSWNGVISQLASMDINWAMFHVNTCQMLGYLGFLNSLLTQTRVPLSSCWLHLPALESSQAPGNQTFFLFLIAQKTTCHHLRNTSHYFSLLWPKLTVEFSFCLKQGHQIPPWVSSVYVSSSIGCRHCPAHATHSLDSRSNAIWTFIFNLWEHKQDMA